MKLKKIEKIENKKSYDISVKDTNCFFVNGILVHNSNAGVCFNKSDGIWVQSRENIITPLSDNAGFAFFVETNKTAFLEILNQIAEKFEINLDENTISLYGEWAGSSIQKGVAITNIPKSFFIFGIKITPHVETDEERKEKPAYWVDYTTFKNVEAKIFNVNDFKTFEIEIDFKHPELVQNKIVEMTLSVEEECPIAKEFGFSGVGEGIVFTYVNDKGQRVSFKSKGEKHATGSKVKTVKPVDDVRIAKLQELADKVTPEWRLDQMLTNTFNLINGGELDIKRLGEYIKNVSFDVLKEDADIISDAGFEFKDIVKYVSEIAKKYFLVKYNNI